MSVVAWYSIVARFSAIRNILWWLSFEAHEVTEFSRVVDRLWYRRAYQRVFPTKWKVLVATVGVQEITDTWIVPRVTEGETEPITFPNALHTYNKICLLYPHHKESTLRVQSWAGISQRYSLRHSSFWRVRFSISLWPCLHHYSMCDLNAPCRRLPHHSLRGFTSAPVHIEEGMSSKFAFTHLPLACRRHYFSLSFLTRLQ